MYFRPLVTVIYAQAFLNIVLCDIILKEYFAFRTITADRHCEGHGEAQHAAEDSGVARARQKD